MNEAPPLPPGYELATPKAGEDSERWLRAYKRKEDGDTGWELLTGGGPFLRYAEDPKSNRWYARPRRDDQPVPVSDYAARIQPESVLQEAERLVNGDRQQSYGDAYESFDRIAKMWSAYLNTKLKGAERVTPKDVADMMILMKVSRSVTSKKRDNWVDKAGYAELGSQIEAREAAPE